MPIPFRPIARLLTRTLHPAPRVDISAVQTFFHDINKDHQGVLITFNHYRASDYQAWWSAILISAVFPKDIHWVVTSEWTNSGWLTWITHWLFPLGARLFGFTPMPAMPPNPRETEKRAIAVRHVLKYARHESQPVVGMSPEGRDIPGGVLGDLPPGVGRFLYLLSANCLKILPVGIWKENGIISLRFGSPYELSIASNLSADQRDHLAGDIVMHKIAQCLPEGLHGAYQ